MIINPHFKSELKYALSQYPDSYFTAAGKTKEAVFADKEGLEAAAMIFQKNYEDYDCDYDWSMRDGIETVFGIKIPENANDSVDDQKNSFIVQTPHGMLHVYDKKESEYPGVYIDLLHADGSTTTLAMVEYIPGGEGICDYNPTWSVEMVRQEAEVPLERIEKDEEGNDRISAGFVTRGWPDEEHEEDRHFRIFHYGYQKE